MYSCNLLFSVLFDVVVVVRGGGGYHVGCMPTSTTPWIPAQHSGG